MRILLAKYFARRWYFSPTGDGRWVKNTRLEQDLSPLVPLSTFVERGKIEDP